LERAEKCVGDLHTVRVRTATPADIPAMMELERQCATAARWTERQYQSIFQNSCGDAAQRLALVMEDDRNVSSASQSRKESPLIAFLIANHVGAEWELENVVVEPASRRKGVGTKLVDDLLARARAALSEVVFLEVRESNQAARALYVKRGFELAGRRKGYYRKPPEDAILYRRSIT
jgi:ribosomal-protein-alanine acetyltransferase